MRDLEQHILSIIQEFLVTLSNERASRALALNSLLDRDLGLGSLERVELVFRLEKQLGIQLPERVLYESETVADLIRAIKDSHPVPSPLSRATITPTSSISIEQIPVTAESLVDVLQQYAQNNPNRPHIYLQSDAGEEQIISYGQLWDTATICACGLAQLGIQPGDKVAIMLPTGKAFFYAFFAVLLSGAVPVPVYPPVRPKQIGEYAKRQATILHNAQAGILITEHNIEALAHLLKPLVPSLNNIVTLIELMKFRGEPKSVQITAADLALIQYTSGSTGTPKGVMLTHKNLLANIRAIGVAMHIKPTDVGVSWLPLYHDMGLIGSWLGCLYFGVPFVVMSPLAFLMRPERWLWAIHSYRGSISPAPNFAYELCVRKIDDKDLEGLDLSSWRIAFNGAEAVNPGTLERFIQRFSRYGFSAQSLVPVFGLAEAAVGLTIPPLGREPLIDTINRDLFASTRQALPVNEHDHRSLKFVSCGVPLPGYEIRIVDDLTGKILSDRMEGRLQFRGPSAMLGYFNLPEETQKVFEGDWLNTGDYAYIVNKELYITGRKKDVIIKAGKNYYPETMESVVGEIAGIRKGCVIAFGVTDPVAATEKIVIVAEAKENQPTAMQQQITQVITENLVNAIGVPPDIVVLTPAQTIPKTSSGKLRRSQCKELYLAGKLGIRPQSIRKQLIKLWFLSMWHRVKGIFNSMMSFLYTVYVALIFIITAAPLWVMTVLGSGTLSKRWMHKWSKLFLYLIGCRPVVSGIENIPKQPAIIISNHASYMDTFALLGTLCTSSLVFVAKKELTRLWFLRTFLTKHQHILVDRYDIAAGEREIGQITCALEKEQSPVIFPEGTFTHAAGIRPFKLGAFKMAVTSGIPLCPIAIRGTRYVLPSDRWLLRPRSIHVTILPTLVPKSGHFDEIIRLRDKAREEIAHYSQEPLLHLPAAGLTKH